MERLAVIKMLVDSCAAVNLGPTKGLACKDIVMHESGFDQTWVEMGLEAKTEMCVPYGTEAQVHGSHVASIRLMVRSS